MQKKLIALAVAAAISAPAFAADGVNVTVYGKAFASLDSTKTDWFATDPATGAKVSNSVLTTHTNASRLGFKGDDDLGDGYKATFQYEAEFNLDGNSGSATAGGTNGAFLGTRNSKVGMAIDSVGEFFVGNWDTPYKLSHNPIELNDNTTFGTAVNVVGRLGGSAATNLNTRLKDSFNYHSANFSGFQVKIARGFDDAKTPQIAGVAGATGTNQAVTAASATYDNDMFYVGLAMQKHNDTDGSSNLANLGGSAQGTRLVGEYKLGTQGFVGAMVEKLKATNAAAAGNTDYSQTNLELSGKYLVTDKDSLALSYVKAGQATVNAPAVSSKIDSASQITLRYGHAYSKRTELYAMYTQLKNGQGNGVAAAAGGTVASNYNFSGGTGTALTSQAGATLTGLGVGMIVSF